MTKEKIIDDFEKNLAILRALKPRLKTLIEILIKENAIIVHDVQARIKEKQSLVNKIEEKQDKYDELKDITDIVGIRIITYFNDDVDLLAEMIEKEFNIDEENSIDKRITDPDRFGYASLHYVVEFKKERLDFIEYKEFKDIKFEIQIRSILQHAWAEIEHDLGYKAKNELPEGIRRDFSRISSLLEIADNEFFRIKEYLKNYEREVEHKIENHALDVEIDKISLIEYMKKSPLVNEIFTNMMNTGKNIQANYNFKYVESHIPSLDYFEINTISKLNTALNENKDNIVKFFDAWVQKRAKVGGSMGIHVVLYYLFLVLIYKEFSKEKLMGFLKASSFQSTTILKKFEELQKKEFNL